MKTIKYVYFENKSFAGYDVLRRCEIGTNEWEARNNFTNSEWRKINKCYLAYTKLAPISMEYAKEHYPFCFDKKAAKVKTFVPLNGIKIPKGWRQLPYGTKLLKGDKYWGNNKWLDDWNHDTAYGIAGSEPSKWIYIREIKSKNQTFIPLNGISIPEGWYQLPNGAKILEGDEVYMDNGWTLTANAGYWDEDGFVGRNVGRKLIYIRRTS